MSLSSRSLGHRAPLFWLVLPLMAGLALGHALVIRPAWWQWAIAAAGALGAVFALWRAPRCWAPAVVVAMSATGLALFARERARLGAWDALPPREARLGVQIDRVFPQGDAKKASGLATVVRADGHLKELIGQRIYFSLVLRPGEIAPVRSAVASAVGVLVTLPAKPPTNTFDGYLANAGINFRLTRGRILAEETPPIAYYAFCAHMAARFKTILGLGIAEKRPALTGLLRAMMLGETHELSDEQHTLFMQSGTMHLFAISGLNIAVIASALHAVLSLLRLPRWACFAVGTSLLWLFVDITGASPSAVRAFIMAAFLQTAFVLRRPSNPLAALVASALVVLLISPLQLFGGSFLMSYAIVAALLVLGLPLSDRWQELWRPWRDLPEATWNFWHHTVSVSWRWLAAALAIGIATSLVSILTSVQFFNLLTPGSLLANLLLIPAAGIATLAGFTAVACGLVGFTFGASLCNHAAAFVLWGIEALVQLSVKLPGAFMPAKYSAAWLGSTALLLLLASLVWGYATGWRRERGGWWPPFVIVGTTLLLGVRFGA